jgi:hypothetical protein
LQGSELGALEKEKGKPRTGVKLGKTGQPLGAIRNGFAVFGVGLVYHHKCGGNQHRKDLLSCYQILVAEGLSD